MVIQSFFRHRVLLESMQAMNLQEYAKGSWIKKIVHVFDILTTDFIPTFYFIGDRSNANIYKKKIREGA